MITRYSCIEQLYLRLLADIVRLTGLTLEAPDELTYAWILKEGPQLDKELLRWTEDTDSDYPTFPDWVKPLSEFFRRHRDPVSLGFLRQLLVFGYKAEFEPNDDQIQAAQAAYSATESDNAKWNTWFKSHATAPALFRSVRQIVARVIYRVDWSKVRPGHGPGAVFPPSRPSQKSNWSSKYQSIDAYYPWDNHFGTLPNYWDRAGCYSEENTLTDILCNLTYVPKDSRGPRLISVHPKEAIWIQQGQRRLLEHAITSHPYTRGHIVFDDQTVNGACALASSSTRELCSLDLKEASDRLTTSLVEYLFGGAYPWISAARATSVRLFSGRVIPLEKWAPMGNCLVFPVQSLVFYAIVRAGIRARYGLDCNDIYVFGDDILFPRDYYDGVCDALVSANFIVNVNKSFRHGFFRESCGIDAYHGIKVIPHRIRKHDASTVSGAVSLCDLAKRMVIEGYDETSAAMYSEVRKHWDLHYSNNPDAQGIYEYVDADLLFFLRNEPSLRWNKRYHRYETQILQVKPLIERIASHDWYHVADSLNRLENPFDEVEDWTVRRNTPGAIAPSALSNTGLEYTVPYRTRPERGWTALLLK